MLVCTQILRLTGDANIENTKAKEEEGEEFIRTSSFSSLRRLGVCVCVYVVD